MVPDFICKYGILDVCREWLLLNKSFLFINWAGSVSLRVEFIEILLRFTVFSTADANACPSAALIFWYYILLFLFILRSVISAFWLLMSSKKKPIFGGYYFFRAFSLALFENKSKFPYASKLKLELGSSMCLVNSLLIFLCLEIILFKIKKYLLLTVLQTIILLQILFLLLCFFITDLLLKFTLLFGNSFRNFSAVVWLL